MSRPIAEGLSEIRARIHAAAHVLVGLDYDGTLTPIVDNPAQALVGSETQAVLQAMAARADMTLAIISGRRLQDVRNLVGIEGLIYAGNHGLEIRGPAFEFTEPTAFKMRHALSWLAAALGRKLAGIPGVLVECKALTLSVHYRQVPISERSVVCRHVQAAAGVAPEWFHVCDGNHVFELRPRVAWHKGSALAWIAYRLGKSNTVVLYLGDDRTDEDAFAAMKDAITVKVGEPGNTCATYHVDGPAAVHDFLVWVLNTPGRGHVVTDLETDAASA